MADELVPTSGVEGFITSLVGRDEGNFWSPADTDAASRIFRGCGVYRKYIALGYVQSNARLTLHDRQRFDQECFSLFQVDAEHVVRLARTAEIEIDLFGPLTADPDRLSRAITNEQAREFAKLETSKQRQEAYKRISALEGAAGKGLMRDTANVVQHILAEAKARAEKKALKAKGAVPDDYDPFKEAPVSTTDEAEAVAGIPVTEAPRAKSGKATKDEPLTGEIEEFPWSQVEEALLTAATWCQNKECDGERKWRIEVADRLCEFAELIRRSK